MRHAPWFDCPTGQVKQSLYKTIVTIITGDSLNHKIIILITQLPIYPNTKQNMIVLIIAYSFLFSDIIKEVQHVRKEVEELVEHMEDVKDDRPDPHSARSNFFMADLPDDQDAG